MLSASIQIKPQDRRCRYWAKVVRDGAALPTPSAVNSANDINASYSRHGDEELFEGDFLFQGEENHHRIDRGWTYWVGWVNADGAYVSIRNPGTELKAKLKARGLRRELLAGAGSLAACVRVAHAVRDGVYRFEAP